MRAILTPIVIAVVLALLATACSTADGHRDTDPLSVVASFYPLAEAAERIGGDVTHVTNLTPPGVEPHDLELTPDQVEAIVDVLDAVDPLPAPPGEAEEGLSVDPHVWLDPERYAAIVGALAGRLGDAAPDDRATFHANASTFVDTLDALDAGFRDGLASCDRREIVTNHAAFGYLAAAYDLQQVAISGLEPDAEPTPDRLAELAGLVERDGITTIFTEELVPPDVAETLAEEVGVRTAILHTLEGAPEGGADYVSTMRENLDTLRAALGCH
jgi:zinc transport system substrate-binding protein